MRRWRRPKLSRRLNYLDTVGNQDWPSDEIATLSVHSPDFDFCHGSHGRMKADLVVIAAVSCRFPVDNLSGEGGWLF